MLHSPLNSLNHLVSRAWHNLGRCLPLLLILGFGARASAAELVIDKILISKHPIATPYYVYVDAKAGHSEASFHVAKKPYGNRLTHDAAIEIPMHLTLKDVQLHSWASVTLHLDNNDHHVTSYKAEKKHTGRIQILHGSHSTQFIPQAHNPAFIYEVFYHARG